MRNPEELPQPEASRTIGHLGRWGRDPLGLLAEGARAGDPFGLLLWRRAVVGFGPEWNRAVLRDLDSFVSGGSLSGLTPYLAAGVVQLDQPAHDPRRRELNPHFASEALRPFDERLRGLATALLPSGGFEALDWSSRFVRQALDQVLFGGRMPDPLLRRFLEPLHRPLPFPFRPRPRLFRRMEAAIRQVLADPPAGSVAAHVAGMPDAARELRVALAAGYDTTSHTLAWSLWHRAGYRPGTCPETGTLVDEVLRLYPAGWIGSRITTRSVEVGDVVIPARTLVLYSPYLTHRDPRLWADPDRFDPGRFVGRGGRAFGYLPFGGGPRTCLGVRLAKMLIRHGVDAFDGRELERLTGDPTPSAGLTLRPGGPLWLSAPANT